MVGSEAQMSCCQNKSAYQEKKHPRMEPSVALNVTVR